MVILTALSVAVSIIVGLITIAYAFSKWRYGYWRRRGIPYCKPSFPFGNFSETFTAKRHISYVMQDIHNEFGDKPFGGVFICWSPALLLKEPEIIREVMVKHFGSHFQNRVAKAHEKLDPILFKNLFMARGERWRSLRNHMSPTFTSGKMKMMFPLIQEKGHLLSELLNEKILEKGSYTVDFKELLAEYTTDVISSCAFGIETNSLDNPNHEFRDMGRKLFHQSFRHLINTLIITTFPSLVNVTRAVFIRPEICEFFRKVVWDVVEEREKKNIKRGDFMDLLIQLKNTGKIEETDSADEKAETTSLSYKKSLDPVLKNFQGDDFVAQIVLFFGAGFETSSTTGSFALFELAANPEVQDRLIKEVDATLTATGGKITYEAVQSMSYLDKVISETLRKYPPLAVLDRECTNEYRNEKYNLVIEKGTPVMVSLFGLHRDPKYFPDPESFIPERFSEENAKKIPHYVYMPFGEGPRNCVGARFGVLQSKVSLVNILSCLRVSLTDELKGMKSLPIYQKLLILSVKGGIPLRVTKRASPFQMKPNFVKGLAPFFRRVSFILERSSL